MNKIVRTNRSIPENKAGIGLRGIHRKDFLENTPKIKKDVGWLEVHSENYYNDLNPQLDFLLGVRKDFPLSLHSVGNSLGSASGLDFKHLKKLKKLIKKTEPFLVSDHISWGKVTNAHLNDLLPVPYSEETLKIMADNVSQMQDFLGMEILVENPSTYLAFKHNDFGEAEFINNLCKKTGCKLLLDVNNIFVSSQNNQEFEPKKYIQTLDQDIVREIHLAGHSSSTILEDKEILIDTHNNVVRDEVWEIYQAAIKKFGQIPSLIEWDLDIPEIEVLLLEARKTNSFLHKNA